MGSAWSRTKSKAALRMAKSSFLVFRQCLCCLVRILLGEMRATFLQVTQDVMLTSLGGGLKLLCYSQFQIPRQSFAGEIFVRFLYDFCIRAPPLTFVHTAKPVLLLVISQGFAERCSRRMTKRFFTLIHRWPACSKSKRCPQCLWLLAHRLSRLFVLQKDPIGKACVR